MNSYLLVFIFDILPHTLNTTYFGMHWLLGKTQENEGNVRTRLRLPLVDQFQNFNDNHVGTFSDFLD